MQHADPDTTTPRPPRVPSEEIFLGEGKIVIEHNGEEYILRITRQNKLLLTK